MDLTQLIATLAAVVGMLVFALLATVPTLLELEDPIRPPV